MKKCFSFFILGIFILVCHSVPGDIDHTGRISLFDVSPFKKDKNASLEFKESNKQAEVRFSAPTDVDLRDTLFALHIKGAPLENPPLVFLNGRRVNFSPVCRKDGLLFRLPPGRILQDENILEFRSSGSAALSFDSLEAFSLIDSFEEVHFDMAFSDVTIQAQPAKHPDQDKYDALHYDLSLETHMDSTLISNAVLAITGRVTAASMSQLVLDFNPNGGSMAVSKVEDGVGTNLSFSINTANNWLLVTLPETFTTSETFTVKVFYSGYPASTGSTVPFGAPYRVETHGSPSVPIIYTFSQPYGGRHWWPSKDIPEDKATIDLHITAEKPYFVVSNGKLLSIEDLGPTKQRFHYSETYPVVTYLVSICCTDYQYVSGVYTASDGVTTMPIGHYVYPENYEAEKNGLIGTLEAMICFADLFGEYPFLTEKYVTATHNSGAGMEHQTCTSMPEGNLSPDGRHRRNIHELSHQWFADCVTMDHYDHLWLNEGWGTYCEALYQEYYNGKTAYHNYVNGWNSTGVSNTQPLVSTSADSFSGSVVYRKGAWVVHMLRRVVGDENFFIATRNYYEKYKYGTVLTGDLQAEFEAVHGSSLEYFFQEWAYGIGRPTYQVSWSVEKTKSSNIVHLSLNQTQSSQTFTMPLDVRIRDFNGNTETYVVFNNQKTQVIEIDTGSFEPNSLELDPDIWVLRQLSMSVTPMPVLKTVMQGFDEDTAVLSWTISTGDVLGYQIYMSDNYTTWTLVADTDVLPPETDTFTIPGLDKERDYYFGIRALSSKSQPSYLSDVYGFRMGNGAGKVLIVDGYDRWDSQGRGISHPWAAWHGKAVNACGISFDTCANEAVINGNVLLTDYKAVLWVLGEESTIDDSFDATEQGLVTAYLKAGGNLFVSGAELGYDLDFKNNGRAFYRDYLKAIYVNDDSHGVFDLQGTASGIFKDLTLGFDHGSTGTYTVQYPDIINTNGGSIVCLNYGSTADAAGIQFSGMFPSGATEGKVVNLGFPFETIYPSEARNEVMKRVLEFFGLQPESQPTTGYFFY